VVSVRLAVSRLLVRLDDVAEALIDPADDLRLTKTNC
jgi:hypothetical protein